MMCGVKSRLAGITIPLLSLVLLVTSSQLQAQVFFAGPGGNNEEAMKKQFIDSLEKKKVSAENRIRSRIADMDRACDLTEAQQKKLSIASKGAVKASIDKAKKSMEEQAKAMGFEIDFDEVETEDPKEDEEELDNNNAAGGAAIMVQAIGLAGPGRVGDSNVENNKIWKSAVKKVLDEDQTKKWDEWLEKRNAYQRRVAVEQFVAKADRKLLLSPQQREELAKYVDEKHGKKLLRRATSNNRNDMGMNFIINGQLGGQNAAADDEADAQLKEILSESQLQEWQDSMEGQLSGMGMGMGGNINVIGNAINGINIVEELNVEELDIDEMQLEVEDDDN